MPLCVGGDEGLDGTGKLRGEQVRPRFYLTEIAGLDPPVLPQNTCIGTLTLLLQKIIRQTSNGD